MQYAIVVRDGAGYPQSCPKPPKIYEFKKDGSYTIHGTDYKGEAIETDTGTYTIIDSFLLAKKSSGLVWTYYIFNGKLLNQTPYVIDK